VLVGEIVKADDVVAALRADGGAALKAFLRSRRWFAGKARGIEDVQVVDWAVVDSDGALLLTLLDVDRDRYFVPLAASSEESAGEAIARVGGRAIVDGHALASFGRTMVRDIARGRDIAAQRGRFVCRPVLPWAGPDPSRIGDLHERQFSGEQSNTSVAVGPELILKSVRRPRRGVNPEVEITDLLTRRTAFRHIAPLIGWVDYIDETGEASAVSVLQGFVQNTGDGWRHVVDALRRSVDAVEAIPGQSLPEGPSERDPLVREMRELGRVTGGLHAALASDADTPAFAPERMTPADAARWGAEIVAALARLGAAAAADARIARALGGAIGTGAHEARVQADLDRLAAAGGHKIRCHGDYHLGQVLKTADSFVVIDFEGEPSRPLAERRAKHTPLRDVAGMLRSFNYAVHTVLRERPPEQQPRAAAWLDAWEHLARGAFLDGYASGVRESAVRLVPDGRADLERACAPFEIDKACYELGYELDNRPDWVPIPLAGLARLLGPRHS
jgi:maltose alpha-D-glucosyltransferase / alpha-amylase